MSLGISVDVEIKGLQMKLGPLEVIEVMISPHGINMNLAC